jgi:hypothetical protein
MKILALLISILLWSFLCIPQASQPNAKTLRRLKTKLERIQDNDWFYRRILDSVRAKFGIGSKEYKAVFAVMDSSDKENQQQLFPIIDQYGWLGRSQVGEKANDAIFKVVQHSNLACQQKYFPLMEESAAKGESNKEYLNWLEDRILVSQDKPTKHGTQGFDVQRKEGTVDYYTDRIRANEERKKEGLDTIPNEYAK